MFWNITQQFIIINNKIKHIHKQNYVLFFVYRLE